MLTFDRVATRLTPAMGPRIRLIALSLAMSFGLAMPAPVAAACGDNYEHAVDHAVPQQTAEGARITTTLRTASAYDWSDPGIGGHVGVHLWVATDSLEIADTFVEVFLVDGKYPGTGGHRRYVASAQFDYPSSIELRYWSPLPPLNTTARLSAFHEGGTSYRATFSWNGASGQTGYSGRSPNTIEFEAGVEATHQCSRQDRVFITNVEFRRKSDNAWIDINNQSLSDDTFAKTGPCVNATNFRAWINSATHTGVCQ